MRNQKTISKIHHIFKYNILQHPHTLYYALECRRLHIYHRYNSHKATAQTYVMEFQIKIHQIFLVLVYFTTTWSTYLAYFNILQLSSRLNSFFYVFCSCINADNNNVNIIHFPQSVSSYKYSLWKYKYSRVTNTNDITSEDIK